MGTIIKRELKSGDTKFIVQLRVAGTPYESKQFNDEFEAVRYESEREAQLRIQASSKRGGTVKGFMSLRFADVITEYQQLKLEKHRIGLAMIKPFLADMTVAELTRANVKELIRQALVSKTRLHTNYSGGAIAKMFTCATAAYRWKLEQMDLPDLPTPFKSGYITEIAGTYDIPRDRRLEHEEEVRLRERITRNSKHQEWVLMVDLAIETAARQQELVLATWKEFDLTAGIWNIPREHTKTRKARQMPLSHKAMRLLEEHQRQLQYPPKDSRVFVYLNDTDMVSSMFRRLTKEANLVDFHFHDLRHEAISRIVLYRRQLSIYEVMRMVGHTSLEMLNRYANLRGDELAVKFNQ